ncbi:MAG: succinyldiaminopimelate transaminase [Halioglobus sp.]
MNPNLIQLQPYPFQRLKALFEDITPTSDKKPISLGIGEPQHASPDFVLDTIAQNLGQLAKYPTTLGMDALREAIARWLTQRFALSSVNPQSQVLPVNGTREALFAFAQAVVDGSSHADVLCPNPFYQIYEGAALLAGAQPVFINCTQKTHFLPDFDAVSDSQWEQCQLLYICTPGNPTGAVMSLEQMKTLIALAQKFEFVVASDECYSEIYADESNPPPGLLQACEALGNTDYSNCVVFHSLSKRSNLPGLRSGFVAGDSDILKRFAQYRTYHGCAMPIHHQLGSIAAWNDEEHVRVNRQRYREKFSAVLDVLQPYLDISAPEAGFYLWPKTPVGDTVFAQALYAQEHVTVLPGQYLARQSMGENPGENRVRMALVASLEECVEAAERIANLCSTLSK